MLVVKVPLVNVRAVDTLKASAIDHVAEEKPEFPNVNIELIVFPLEVITYDPLFGVKNKFPVCVHPMPEAMVRLPAILILRAPPKMPVKPVKFKLRAALAAETVTVTAPELASKNTSSALVGTVSPPGPPDVAAHLVPAVPSQLAVPPTQYLSAMTTPSHI